MHTAKLTLNVLLFGILAYVFYRFFDVEDFNKILSNAELIYIPLICIAFALSNLTNGFVTNKLTLKLFNIHTNFKVWFGLAAANSFANLIVPLRAGTLFKAIYLKKNYGFDISYSGGVLLFSSLISLITILVMSTIIFGGFVSDQITFDIAVWAGLPSSTFTRVLFSISLTLSVTGILFLIFCAHFKIEPKSTSGGLLDRLVNITAAFSQSLKWLSKSPGLISAYVVNALINLALNIAVLYIAYLSIGIEVSIIELTAINLLTTVSFYLAITPGNLGVQELTIATMSMLLGITFEAGLLAALIMRVASTLTIIILGWIYMAKLSNEQITLKR